MASLWTSAISDAWGIVADLMADFVPVVGLAIGLIVAGSIIMVVVGMFRK